VCGHRQTVRVNLQGLAAPVRHLGDPNGDYWLTRRAGQQWSSGSGTAPCACSTYPPANAGRCYSVAYADAGNCSYEECEYVQVDLACTTESGRYGLSVTYFWELSRAVGANCSPRRLDREVWQWVTGPVAKPQPCDAPHEGGFPFVTRQTLLYVTSFPPQQESTYEGLSAQGAYLFSCAGPDPEGDAGGGGVMATAPAAAGTAGVAAPPCRHRGDDLLASAAAAAELDPARRWALCLAPGFARQGQPVCPCAGCGPACPGYDPDVDS
jgi:hypothetical protein